MAKGRKSVAKPFEETHFLAKFDPAIAALSGVIGSSRAKDVLAEERDAYAEIGRIVGLPFSASKV